MLGGGIPAFWGVATLEIINNLAAKPAVQQKITRRCCLWGFQLLPVELVHRLIRRDEPLPSTRLLIAGTGRAALVINVVANLLRHGFHGLRKRDLFHLHQEAEYIAAFTGGKAVIITALRADVEGRRLFILERAQSLQRIVPSRFELHIFAHDFF